MQLDEEAISIFSTVDNENDAYSQFPLGFEAALTYYYELKNNEFVSSYAHYVLQSLLNTVKHLQIKLMDEQEYSRQIQEQCQYYKTKYQKLVYINQCQINANGIVVEKGIVTQPIRFKFQSEIDRDFFTMLKVRYQKKFQQQLKTIQLLRKELKTAQRKVTMLQSIIIPTQQPIENSYLKYSTVSGAKSLLSSSLSIGAKSTGNLNKQWQMDKLYEYCNFCYKMKEEERKNSQSSLIIKKEITNIKQF